MAPGLTWEYWQSVSTAVVNTDVRVSFPTPGGDLITGAGLQEFRVQVRKKGTGDNPSARVELYETGGTSPLATVVADTAVASTTVLSGTWDAALLADISGAAVECKVVGTGAVDGSVEVGAIEWNAIASAPAGLTITGGFIPSGESTVGATVGRGPVTVTGGFVASSATVYGSAIGIPVYNTVALVGFTNPPNVLELGAGLQEFRVQVRKKGTGANPTLNLELWENGSKITDLLTNQTVSNTTSQLFSATWNASLLSFPSGANAQLRVVGNGAGGGSVEIGAVEWNAQVQESTTIAGGFIPSGERTLGARLYGDPQTITAGFIPTGQATYGATLSAPYTQAGFVGGELTPDSYVPGNYPPRIPDEKTFGATLTTGIGAGRLATEEQTFGASISAGTATITAGFIPSGEKTYGASVVPGEVVIGDGYIPSEEQTFGATVSATATITAGFIPSEEKTYGASVVGSAVTLTAGFIPSGERTFGAALTSGAGVQNVVAGYISSSEKTYGPTLTPGPVTLSAGFVATTAQVFGAQLQQPSALAITGGFIPTGERTFGGLIQGVATRAINAGFIGTGATVYGGTIVLGAAPLGDAPLYPDAILEAVGYAGDVLDLRDDPENPSDVTWLTVV